MGTFRTDMQAFMEAFKPWSDLRDGITDKQSHIEELQKKSKDLVKADMRKVRKWVSIIFYTLYLIVMIYLIINKFYAPTYDLNLPETIMLIIIVAIILIPADLAIAGVFQLFVWLITLPIYKMERQDIADEIEQTKQDIELAKQQQEQYAKTHADELALVPDANWDKETMDFIWNAANSGRADSLKEALKQLDDFHHQQKADAELAEYRERELAMMQQASKHMQEASSAATFAAIGTTLLAVSSLGDKRSDGSSWGQKKWSWP